MTYVIEKDIPMLPSPHHRNSKYPFAELGIGDSFEVPTDKRKSVATVAHQWAERHGVVFTTRTTELGIRIWRRA